MGAEVARKPKQSYSEAEVQRALTEIAACAGNTRLASKHLAEDDLEIDHSVLWRWKAEKHQEKYEAIREQMLPAIRRQAADLHMASAARRMEVADELMDRLKEKQGDLEAKDLSTSIRNLDVGAGVHQDKATNLSEQNQPKPAQNFGNMLREFKQMTGIDISLSVPEEPEIQEAQVVEDESEQLSG